METGTSSPTCKTAGWLSTTTRDGDESTLTFVNCESASSTNCALIPDESRMLEPGSTRWTRPETSEVAAAPTTLVVAWSAAAVSESLVVVVWLVVVWRVLLPSPVFRLVSSAWTP